MRPKKELIEKLRADGVHKKVDQRVSAAFLLMNLSRTYIDEAEELLKDYNLCVGETKKNLSMANKYYERFASELRTIVNHSNENIKKDFWSDYEHLEKMVTDFITNTKSADQSA
jgi:hypothetical protein